LLTGRTRPSSAAARGTKKHKGAKVAVMEKTSRIVGGHGEEACGFIAANCPVWLRSQPRTL